MKVYAAYKNSDQNEGRGPMVIDAIFSSWKVAAEYIDFRPGIQGRVQKWSALDYGDWQIKEFEVYDDVIVIEDVRKKEVRKRALSKLTGEELKALGL